MENIIRGTTPTLIVDFTGVLDVSTITDAVLTIRTRAGVTEKMLTDLTVDTEHKTVSYHFSQAETLALTANDNVRFQMDVVASGERYRCLTDSAKVADTQYSEVL